MTKDRKAYVTKKDEYGHYGMSDLRVSLHNVTPSWQRYGNGQARLEMTSMRPEGGERWLSITVAETGEKSTREAYITLYGSEARAVYEYLKSKFEGEEG